MSAPVWCEYVCRQCATHIAGEFSRQHLPKGFLNRMAKRSGAKIKHDEIFCSEVCLERFEKENKR